MDQILAKSKVRQNILRLLFLNENKRFYLSEIADKIGASAGNVQRELKRLEASGMVRSEKVGNLRYYMPDKQSPVFTDISSLVVKTIGIEEGLKKVLAGLKLDFAFIFGSYAKDALRSDSDIDLFLIGQPDDSILLTRINELEKKIAREINYHVYPLEEFKTKFKANSFLSNIVKNHIMLIGNSHDFKRLHK